MMRQKPTCSVIVPARNVAPYIKAALQSIAAQKRDDLEVIVVDDGSTDATLQVIADMMPHMPYVRVIKGAERGVAEARNLALSEACADFIAFLDADDVWQPNKLSQQLALLEAHPDVVLCATDFRYLDVAGTDLGSCFAYHKQANIRLENLPRLGAFVRLDAPLPLLLVDNLIGTSTVVMRREALQNAKGFANCLFSSEDWELWLRLAEQGVFALLPEVTTDYLMRPNSETSRKRDRLEANRLIIAPYLKHSDHSVARAARKAWGKTYVAAADVRRLQGQHMRAAALFGRALCNRLEKRIALEVLKSLKLAISALFRGKA